MDEILKTLALLVAALFWGGVVTVDFIVTPARTSAPNVSREASRAIGNQIFRLFGLVQVGLGLLLLVIVLIGGTGVQVILPAVFLLVLALLNLGLEKLMAALNSPDLSDEEREAKRPQWQQLHRAYFAADIFKIILGIILIAALVAA